MACYCWSRLTSETSWYTGNVKFEGQHILLPSPQAPTMVMWSRWQTENRGRCQSLLQILPQVSREKWDEGPCPSCAREGSKLKDWIRLSLCSGGYRAGWKEPGYMKYDNWKKYKPEDGLFNALQIQQNNQSRTKNIPCIGTKIPAQPRENLEGQGRVERCFVSLCVSRHCTDQTQA